jgi:hypothetical protein
MIDTVSNKDNLLSRIGPQKETAAMIHVDRYGKTALKNVENWPNRDERRENETEMELKILSLFPVMHARSLLGNLDSV